MNIQYIVTKALVDYDLAKPIIRYLQKETIPTGIKTGTDTERSHFKFYKKDTNELILETEFEFLGIFYDKLNVWSWAWSHTGLTNSESYLSKEILKYGLDLGSELSYLKSILTTSRGLIKEKTQLDVHVALGSSIIKQPYIYPFILKVGEYKLIYYCILLNKEKLNKLNEELTKEITEELGKESTKESTKESIKKLIEINE